MNACKKLNADTSVIVTPQRFRELMLAQDAVASPDRAPSRTTRFYDKAGNEIGQRTTDDTGELCLVALSALPPSAAHA